MHAEQISFLPTLHFFSQAVSPNEAHLQLSYRGLTNYVVDGAIPIKPGAIWHRSVANIGRTEMHVAASNSSTSFGHPMGISSLFFYQPTKSTSFYRYVRYLNIYLRTSISRIGSICLFSSSSNYHERLSTSSMLRRMPQSVCVLSCHALAMAQCFTPCLKFFMKRTPSSAIQTRYIKTTESSPVTWRLSWHRFMASACAYLHHSVLYKGACPPSLLWLGRQSLSIFLHVTCYMLHVTHGSLLFAGWRCLALRCQM